MPPACSPVRPFKRPRPLAFAMPFLVAVLAAAPAWAQQPAPAKLDPVQQEAEQLFLQGREAVKKGDLVIAAEKFQRSQELDPTPGTLLNLASVEEQMGRLVKALEHFESTLKGLAENDERYPVAKTGAERVRPRVPSLRIDRAAGSPADMTIRLDGAPLAASTVGVYQLLDPGTYTVSTSAPGHEERRYEVKLNEAMRATVAVEPGKEQVKVRVVQPQPTSSRPTALQGAGLAAAGVGLAGLGIGAVTGILALGKKSDAATACPDPTHCTGSGLVTAKSATSTGQALASVSTASFAVGLAGAVVGVTLLIAGREKTPTPSASIAPWVLPGGAGLGAQGRF